ncbi:DUF2829 domain-containing protein, partial [Xenorhabdus griffiniae]
TRSVWGDKGMYLAITPRVSNLIVEEGSAYAVDGVAVGTQYDYLTHIDLRNEHGNFVPWQPTQEDMMACDWEFVEEKEEEPVKPEPKPEPIPEPTPEPTPETPKYNLVFDITRQPGGNMLNTEVKEALDVIENDTTKRGPLPLVWSYLSYNDLNLHFTNESKDKEWFEDLGNNALIISINDKEYNLGKASVIRPDSNKVAYRYENSESEKVVELLKQEGKTYRFHCKWYN